MLALPVLAALLFGIGIFAAFGLTPYTLLRFSQQRAPSLKKLANPQKEGKLLRQYRQVHTALEVTGQTGKVYVIFTVSVICIIVGLLSGIGFGNPFLIPVFVISFASLPFLYVRLQYRDYKAILLDEMEISLDVITSSYDRTENLLTAIDENIDLIGEPLKELFSRFLFEVRHTGLPVSDALLHLKDMVQEGGFKNWCDAMLRCTANRSLKASLRPAVSEITDLREAKEDAKTVLRQSKSDFIFIFILGIVFMAVKYVIPLILHITLPAIAVNLILAIDVSLGILLAVRVYLWLTDIQFT